MGLRTSVILFVIVSTAKLQAQDAIAYYNRSQEQMLTGNYQEALSTIDKALLVDSSKAAYFLQKATLYYHLQEYKDALRLCYSANRIEPDNPKVHYLRGLLSMATDNSGGAVFFFGKVIAQSPDQDYVYNSYIGRGKTNLRNGKTGAAKSDFRLALQLKPDSIEPQFLLATAFLQTKEADSALMVIEKVLQTAPEKPQSYKLLGNIYHTQKNYSQAETAYNKYCSMVINDAEVLQDLSALCLENKDYDKARTYIERAITLFPSEPLNFKILAMIFLESGRNEEGCNNMFKAFQLGYLEKYGYDALDVYQGKCEGK
ncbi:MAG TPA: tetratricopeptide repeat protein [Bacteroidales bacterium]|nr:tetratricopeptide repeat protein [Bacteroidales bacterium]